MTTGDMIVIRAYGKLPARVVRILDDSILVSFPTDCGNKLEWIKESMVLETLKKENGMYTLKNPWEVDTNGESYRL